ncbi:hypothetical protein PXK00_08930 [Phaeobacter sp. QD34_3]|uniref:hypothetical protein n=1 Tax=unclassified Phaeobacter TaxID=2621772 RepID=UPI00237FB1FF|nr:MULTISPECIES: hypothetical protein [unclassified Phaeobacter]MDE4133235.1 hypothetical protein [Phaeobacter sp. QD34_3]MDE4136978.1 hypothetical protein [Phaeobacter sp. QD34_24]
MSKKILAAAIALIALPLAAKAAPIAYECDFKSYTAYGGIPPKSIFVVDAVGGTAMVYDGYIHKVFKAPIAADFEELGAHKYRLKWTLKGFPLRGNTSDSASYSVRLDTARTTANIQMNLHGDDADRRGTGSCKRIK